MATLPVPIVVIGAGPAGLAAAGALVRSGVPAVVVDERAETGGRLRDHPHLSDDGRTGDQIVEALLADLPADRVAIRSQTVAWGIFDRWRVAVSTNGQTEILTTPAVVLAAGLVQRVHPFPGWTTPGVMTAHAARSLLRRHVPPGRRAAVLGKTALGAWIARELEEAGLEVLGRFEALGIMVEGTSRVNRLILTGGPDEPRQRLDLDLVVLADGTTPLIELALQAGCLTAYDEPLGGHVPLFSKNLATSQPGIFVAGGSIGAQSTQEAIALGRLAGVAAAAAAGTADASAVEAARVRAWSALEECMRAEADARRLEAWRAIADMGAAA